MLLSVIDPTARGDMCAALLRRWYEANRETWWDRHRPGADRKGSHADAWAIGLMNEAGRIAALTNIKLYRECNG
jgi:hypothetical protein